MGDLHKFKSYSTENLCVEWFEPKVNLPVIGQQRYDIFNYSGAGTILEFAIGFSGHEVMLDMIVDGVYVMSGMYIEMIMETHDNGYSGSIMGYSKDKDSFIFKRPIKYSSSFVLKAWTNDNHESIKYDKSYIVREVY